MNNNKWWHQVNRVYQANNHEIDPQHMHGSDVVKEARRLNCNIIIADAGGGISTFYPSKIEWLAKNPYLEPGRDFFGEISTACKKEGVKLFARGDYGHLSIDTADKRPDWVRREFNGSRHQVYDVVSTCPTSEMFREVAVQAFHEQFALYDVDGIYINAMGGRCWCDRCRKLYEDETGLPVPTTTDLNDLNYRRWIEWGYNLVRRLVKFQYEGVKRWSNDKLYFIDVADYQEPGWIHSSAQDLNWLAEFQDMVSTEAFNDIPKQYPDYLAPVVARFVRQVADRRNKPGYMFISSFPGHSFPNSNQPVDTFNAWSRTVYLNGLSMIVPWYGHLENNDDMRLAEPCSEAFKFALDHRELLTGAEPIVPVAVVWSRRTHDHYAKGSHAKYYNRFFAACQAMLEEHIPFRVIPDDFLDENHLNGIEVLVLPNVAVLSDAACSNIDAFAAKGGGVIATFETSLFDDLCVPRANYGLNCLGARREPGEQGFPEGWHNSYYHSYMSIAEPDSPLVSGYQGTNILPFKGTILNIATTAKSVSIPLKYCPPQPGQPPEKGWIRQTTQTPLALQSARGNVIYFPCEPDEMFARFRMPDHRRLLGNAVRAVFNTPITTNVPPPMELTFSRKDKGYIIGLINHTGQRLHCPPLPVRDVTVTLKDLHLASAKSVIGGVVGLQHDGNNTVIKIAEVGLCEVIEAE